MASRTLVTAALPYSNGRLHVGHIAGAYLPADIYVRFLRLKKVETLFVCGSDDHGVAIMLSADKAGTTPAELSAKYNELQKKDFEGLGISFDVYGATSQNPYHAQLSQEFFLKLHEQGLFDKQSSKQFFDEQAQMFLPDRYVKGTCTYCKATEQNGDQCENCGKMLDPETLLDPKSVKTGGTVSIRETIHWFIDLSRFEKDVSEWLQKAQLRSTTKTYVEGLLSTGLVKRSMTRDISWGIPVPLKDPDAKNKVLYVWFDAPIGYVSNTMQVCAKLSGQAQNYKDWWCNSASEIIHFIGEDNTIFHCVIWIAMLKAQKSYNLPKTVVVNQYLNFQKEGSSEIEKMSKSRGTAIWIGEYLESGANPDSLRFYLNAIAPESGRTAYNAADLKQRHNAELVNALGNFVNRVLSFTHKFVGPKVPAIHVSKLVEEDNIFKQKLAQTFSKITECLESYRFKEAQEILMAFVREGNVYIDRKAPWTTRKNDMQTTENTLNICIQAIHLVAITLQPFLPSTAKKIASMLNLKEQDLFWEHATIELVAGSVLNTPALLFEKLE